MFVVTVIRNVFLVNVMKFMIIIYLVKNIKMIMMKLIVVGELIFVNKFVRIDFLEIVRVDDFIYFFCVIFENELLMCYFNF